MCAPGDAACGIRPHICKCVQPLHTHGMSHLVCDTVALQPSKSYSQDSLVCRTALAAVIQHQWLHVTSTGVPPLWILIVDCLTFLNSSPNWSPALTCNMDKTRLYNNSQIQNSTSLRASAAHTPSIIHVPERMMFVAARVFSNISAPDTHVSCTAPLP